MIASNYNLWSLAGLVYALAGAAILANAVFQTPPPAQLPRFKSASADTETSRRGALRRMGAQWLDFRIGAVLLVIGFFLQATGAAGTAMLNTPAVFVLLGLALFAGYYGLSRDLIVDGLLVSAIEPQPGPTSKPEIESPLVPKQDAAPVVIVELRQSETAA